MSSQIGFEAVMRIRCTRGMSLHTFHGEYRKGSSSSKQIQKRILFSLFHQSFYQKTFHGEESLMV